MEAAGLQAGALSARAAWWGAPSMHPQGFALRAWCCTPELGGFQRWASPDLAPLAEMSRGASWSQPASCTR